MKILTLLLCAFASIKTINAQQYVYIYTCPTEVEVETPILITHLSFDNDFNDKSSLAVAYEPNQLYNSPTSAIFESAVAGEKPGLLLNWSELRSNSATPISLSSSYSKSIWIYVKNNFSNMFGGYGSGHLIGGYDDFDPTANHLFAITENGIQVYHGNWQAQYSIWPLASYGTTEQIIPIREWHQVGVTYDATQQLFTFYIDGVEVSQQSPQFTSRWQGSSDAKIEIGDFGAHVGGSYRPIENTIIKHVRIYNGAITPAQMMNDYVEDQNAFKEMISSTGNSDLQSSIQSTSDNLLSSTSNNQEIANLLSSSGILNNQESENLLSSTSSDVLLSSTASTTSNDAESSSTSNNLQSTSNLESSSNDVESSSTSNNLELSSNDVSSSSTSNNLELSSNDVSSSSTSNNLESSSTASQMSSTIPNDVLSSKSSSSTQFSTTSNESQSTINLESIESTADSNLQSSSVESFLSSTSIDSLQSSSVTNNFESSSTAEENTLNSSTADFLLSTSNEVGATPSSTADASQSTIDLNASQSSTADVSQSTTDVNTLQSTSNLSSSTSQVTENNASSSATDQLNAQETGLSDNQTVSTLSLSNEEIIDTPSTSSTAVASNDFESSIESGNISTLNL